MEQTNVDDGTLRFDGRVAVVTGAGRGLGRAYAMLLAARGASVVVNDLGVQRDGTDAGEDRAGAVVAEIEGAGGTAVASRDSVATRAGGSAIIDAALGHFGRVDIVVSSAGPIGGVAFGDLGDDELDLYLDSHLRGAFHVIQPAWRRMVEQAHGRVVIVTSQAILGSPGTTHYASAKGGLLGLTKALAMESAGTGVQVNAIMPSANTPGTEGMGTPAFMEWFSKFTPELVAPAVAYLAHDRCQWNGETIVAGAGRVARLFLATTKGIFDPDLTLEDVAARTEEIVDTSRGYDASASAMEDLGLWCEHVPFPDSGDQMAWSS
jgi:NAD(P)-dependent dehydrogenase (short-subunit alcohol dehydrogenase family)